jgi:hypothetical protein
VHGPDVFGVDRVQVLLDELVPSPLQPLAPRAVGLVRHLRADHPERDLLAVELRLQLGFQSRDLLFVLTRDGTQVALAREAPQLPDGRAAVRCGADRLRALELGQVGVLRVDRLELERLLEPRIVEVELLVERGNEAVGPPAKGVELTRGRRG